MRLEGVWPKSTRVGVLTSDATRRRVAEEHADEVTPDATRRRVAEEHAGGSVDIRCDPTAVTEEHADEVTPDATRRRVAEEHAGLTSDATQRQFTEGHADEVTPDATRRRVAEEHADGTALGATVTWSHQTGCKPRVESWTVGCATSSTAETGNVDLPAVLY